MVVVVVEVMGCFIGGSALLRSGSAGVVVVAVVGAVFGRWQLERMV
jgi:hypothetical protein